jgi:hypothetical protein
MVSKVMVKSGKYTNILMGTVDPAVRAVAPLIGVWAPLGGRVLP